MADCEFHRRPRINRNGQASRLAIARAKAAASSLRLGFLRVSSRVLVPKRQSP